MLEVRKVPAQFALPASSKFPDSNNSSAAGVSTELCKEPTGSCIFITDFEG